MSWSEEGVHLLATLNGSEAGDVSGNHRLRGRVGDRHVLCGIGTSTGRYEVGCGRRVPFGHCGT